MKNKRVFFVLLFSAQIILAGALVWQSRRCEQLRSANHALVAKLSRSQATMGLYQAMAAAAQNSSIHTGLAAIALYRLCAPDVSALRKHQLCSAKY